MPKSKLSLKNNLEQGLKSISLRKTQEEYLEKIQDNKIVFCYGPAGTAKTFIACYSAVKLLNDKEINNVVLSKPIQEAGEKLGHLPGEKDDKIAPYITSYKNNFNKIIGDEITTGYFMDETIKFEPLAYMRGDTFDNALMILDEAQNATFDQLILFITRMGKNSKIIISGDVSQHDLKEKHVSLPSFIDIMKDIKSVSTHKFDKKDIVREKILQDVVEKYEKWKNSKD
jgi:phosphate starvation-inducible PhoH-like protein